MLTWQDAVGNVHGRVDGARWVMCVVVPPAFEANVSLVHRSLTAAGPDPDAPALLIGSHYDTVYDAGQYDGALGIIVGAPPSCTGQLNELLPLRSVSTGASAPELLLRSWTLRD